MDGATKEMSLPFDSRQLDDLLDKAGIDALVVTSKHNIQYLLGGYRFFFFDQMDAIGVSRYLPILIYQKGRPADAVYVANVMEGYEKELGRIWVPNVANGAWGSLDAAQLAVAHLKKLGNQVRRIAVETAFIPADAYNMLSKDLPDIEIVDGLFPLERLRAVKTPAELEKLRIASEMVVESMMAVFAVAGPGMTKQQLADRLRMEEIGRGLTFDYCLITAGTSINRAPSGQVLAAGDIFSLDSGGNYHDYIGDVCRMGILGEPDAELVDLLAAIDTVQQAARREVRPGATGNDIYAAAENAWRGSPHGADIKDFTAHGMGLVSHEAPRLSDKAPQKYPGYDKDKPLQPGMVISIETTMNHQKRGFIKLEDTLAVTADGHVAFGDGGRAWNRAGK
ncbi:MAG: Xaa-Pro peptidase family protein [Bauldia sp.]